MNEATKTASGLLQEFVAWADGSSDKPHSLTEDARRFLAAEAETVSKIDAAIELAVRYGGIDGDWHKAWVIDQMVRALSGDRYDAIVAEARQGEDGPETFDWDVGIAP